jgi:hypothetical protein
MSAALWVWNKRNGPAVRHEPDRRPENVENGARKFDPLPGRTDQSRHTAAQ